MIDAQIADGDLAILERLVDITTNNEFHRIARDAKDTAAGAVLCAAVTAAIIGAFVFLPRLFALLKH